VDSDGRLFGRLNVFDAAAVAVLLAMAALTVANAQTPTFTKDVAPILQKRCQECHSMQFEPAVTKREVPHGRPEEAVAVIEDFYANLALQRRPGEIPGREPDTRRSTAARRPARWHVRSDSEQRSQHRRRAAARIYRS